MLIFDDLLMAPLKGLILLGKKISDVVDREQSDEGTIKERLMELQMKFEMDEIDEEEYDRREEELLNLLEQIRVGKQNGE
ncbi:MAG: gas vesicle protein GvpG [Mangrovibacterium sp.]